MTDRTRVDRGHTVRAGRVAGVGKRSGRTAMCAALVACLFMAMAPARANMSETTPAAKCSGALLDEARIACLEDRFAQTDHELNAVYKTALARSRAKSALRTSQRTWLKSTKRLCDAAGSEFVQESALQVAVEDCYARRTVDRIVFLRKQRSRQ